MTTGVSLLLIAVGAILRYAITESVSGIDIPTVGLILMVVGIIGLILSLLYMFLGDRRADVVADVPRDRPVVRRDRDIY